MVKKSNNLSLILAFHVMSNHVERRLIMMCPEGARRNVGFTSGWWKMKNKVSEKLLLIKKTTKKKKRSSVVETAPGPER